MPADRFASGRERGTDGRRQMQIADIFTAFVDARWRYNVLMFIGVFVVSWVGFAFVWWGIAVAHGDNLHTDDDEWAPCMTTVVDFNSALFASIDLQVDILLAINQSSFKNTSNVINMQVGTSLYQFNLQGVCLIQSTYRYIGTSSI